MEKQTECENRLKLGLKMFLKPLASDCQYFVKNKRTCGNESFHNVCNCYYQKGSVIPFSLFVMKRQFAALDWNEQKTRGVNEEVQKWQLELMRRFEKKLSEM